MNKYLYLLILLIGTLLIYLSYRYVDYDVAQWAFSLNKNIYYDTAMLISNAGEATYPLVISALLWLYYKFYTKQLTKAYYSALFFLITVATGLGANVLKIIFGKARPLLLKNENEFGFSWFVSPSNYDHLSFPSGHTTTAFTVATLLALYFPRYIIIFYAYAIIIAIARVVSWNHYVSDVMAAALYAILLSLYLFTRFSPKKEKF